MAMDLIPILLGLLPLAHNAQHSLVITYGRGVGAAVVGAVWVGLAPASRLGGGC